MNNTEVLLYGPLKEKYGSNFIFEETNTVGDVIDALAANFTDFRVDVLKTKNYNVFIDDISIGMDELPLEHLNTKTIKIVPLVVGASGKEMSFGKIVLGAALIAASFAIPPAAGLGIGLASGALSAGVMKIGIGLLLSGFAELIFSPPEEDPDEEQSYLFNGAVNISKQGTPVPLGYGRLRVGSTNISNTVRNFSTDYTKAFKAEYSNEFIKILDCICEGEIEGIVGGTDGVYLNDVPLTEGSKVNIENIDVQYRVGKNDQTYMPGFENAGRVRSLNRDVVRGYTIDGVIVPAVKPVERIIGPNTTAVIIAILWTNGLYDFDKDNNEYDSEHASFELDYTSGSNKTWRPLAGKIGDITVEGTVIAPFKRDFYFKLPLLGDKVDFPIDIRITKKTEDDIPHNDRDDDDEFATDFQWSGLTELIEQKFVYPNTALVGMEFDAKTYESLPQRAYDVKLLKINIPTNYDPIKRTTSGLWKGDFKVEWSDNPAWAFYDMVINNRYGMGQYLGVNNINKWMLYEIAKFCDVQLTDYAGNKEPRYSINTYIAKQDDALVFLRHFSSIFRGMVYWMDNKITATYDHPADPVCVFSNSNVIDGTFTYTGSARDTRYNVVYVSWSDPSIDFKNAIEYVEDTSNIAERGEIVTTDLTALGCTSKAQAFRSGRALLATERETVVFSCTLDNVGGKPGDLTEIYDKYRSNVRHSGRIDRIVGDKVYLDDYPLDLDNKTYKLRLISSSPQTETLENGEVIKSLLPKIHIYDFQGNNYSKKDNSILVTGVNADGNKLSATTDIPKNTVWAIYDDKLTAQIFRIISIAEKEKNVYEINGLAYNINKQDWIDDPAANKIEPLPDTTQSDLLYLITMVNVVENRRAFSNSTTNIISIHWDKAPGLAIKKFIVEYRYDAYDSASGPWVEAGRVDDSSFLELGANMPKGWYTGRVSAVLHNGAIMIPVVSKPVYLTGRALPPHTVSNFRYTILEGGILRLLWDKSNDFDLSHYEIQNGVSWDNTKNTVYPNEKNTYLDILDNFEEKFMIKAIDTSGIESIHFREITVKIVLPTVSNILGKITAYGYHIAWDIAIGTYKLAYTEIKEGTTFVSNQIEHYFETNDLHNWASGNDHVYWLTPIDVRGNRGKTERYDTTLYPLYLENIDIIPDRLRVDISYDAIDYRYNNSTSINKIGERFRLDYVELRTRNSVNNTITTTKIYGENYSAREIFPAIYTYTLTPYDISGRRGLSYISSGIDLRPTASINMYQHIRFDGIKDKVYFDSVKKELIGPLDTAPESWAEHFTRNKRNFSNIQDQITAGYPFYLMPGILPGANTAVYSEIYTPITPITITTDVIISVIGRGRGELRIYVYPEIGSTGTYSATESVHLNTLGNISETHFRVRINGGFDSIKVLYEFRSGTNKGLYFLEEATIIGETV